MRSTAGAPRSIRQSDTGYRLVRLTDDGADVVTVTVIGSMLRCVLDGAVLFEVDSTELRTDPQDALDTFAQDIADTGLSEFRVVEHTVSTGGDDYNLALSQVRALAVRNYLAAVTAVMITANGRGEAVSIADNSAGEGRSTNRRAEIIGQ